jgi:hypothetical protein
MRISRRLRDTYRFDDFKPQARVRGAFGDPLARIVRLTRRRKKRPAGSAVKFTAVTTTANFELSAIFRAVTHGCIWNSRCAACAADGAAR